MKQANNISRDRAARDRAQFLLFDAVGYAVRNGVSAEEMKRLLAECWNVEVLEKLKEDQKILSEGI